MIFKRFKIGRQNHILPSPKEHIEAVDPAKTGFLGGLGLPIIFSWIVGGLFAAAALRKSGWQVDVFERTEIELSGRGAGIVTHDVLIEALRAIEITTDDLGVYVEDRTAYDKNGNVNVTK